MSDSAKWYVIHTYSGYEKNVARTIMRVVENRNLHDLVFDVIVPTETVSEKKDDKIKEHERNVLPGYVLVKMILTDDSWYVVRNVRGVTGFVGPGSKPVPLSDKEFNKLLEAFGSAEDKAKQSKFEVDFKIGDSVRVSGGQLDGFVGIVKSINLEEQTAEVIVSMFGRETPATIGIMQIQKIDD
ncbi:MAG: transcription termination/antitermination protein NusG [Oscillospiraceae bacterium]